MVFSELEYTTNGTFASDTGWTKGAGWTIAAGVATATGAISTAIEQTAGISIVQGKAYLVKYTVTRSAGSVTPNLGGVAGTARSASGTYSEVIIAGSTQTVSFTTSGFTGTLDNVSVRDTGGISIRNPGDFTLDGDELIFLKPPASGTGNIYVFAPYTLIGAAGAAQTASDAAIAAQAAAEAAQAGAETAETNAETAETNAEAALAAIAGLDATSTTSLAIGTGTKVFTTQTGKGFIPGMWVLATSDADPADYMHGSVTTYSGSTLTLSITNTGGSGTNADWTIRLSGTRGATGAAGATGSLGDIAAQTSATPASNDLGVFADVNDSNNTKKATWVDIVGSTLLDEDTMSTNSATQAPTQQSVKAYVDTEIAAIPSAAGWVPLATVTAASDATIDFVNGAGGVVLDGTYKAYVVVISNFVPQTTAQNLNLRFSVNAGSSYISTGYAWSNLTIRTDVTSSAVQRSSSDSVINITPSSQSYENDTGNSAVIKIFDPAATSKNVVLFEAINPSGVGHSSCIRGMGMHDTEQAIDAFQLFMGSGNITSGTFTLYGIAGA